MPLLCLTVIGMLKAIPNKLHLAFDLLFILSFHAMKFQQETASKVELKPEGKARRLEGINSYAALPVALEWSFDSSYKGFLRDSENVS